MDAPTFRIVYPQFADLNIYPDAAIVYWIGTAVERLPPLRWLDVLDEGIGLFTAHKLALGKMAILSNGMGGGVVSSKSVGGVSVAYNTELGIIEGGGAYNLTTYGREFLMLARMVGLGGLQL